MVGTKAISCLLGYFILSAECYHSKEIHQKPLVTVSEGKLRGTVERIYDGSSYFSFKGIPYAEAPVGAHRFQSQPLAPRNWHGIRDASKHGPVCTQYDFTISQYLEGSEQCLFVNVYTKYLKPDAKIPVMVFIHGGSYMSGSGNSDTFSPDLLLQHNVILVTINYRLELLGFLAVDSNDVPGSGGMKDTVAALRWVKKNIAKFGGDPDNITIFGESSGASSVTYLMMSPSAHGLFNKVIAQSGTCFEDWAQARDMKERAFRAAKVLGKDAKNVGELLDFLRSVPPLNLTNLTEKTMTEEEKNRGSPEQFLPVIKENLRGDEPFIDEDPVQKVVKGKVSKMPIMLGYNSGEGILKISDEIKRLDIKNNNVSLFVPRSIVEIVSTEKALEFGRRIQSFYGSITKDNPEVIRDILTDANFAYNTHRFAYLYSKLNAPVYMYRFNYETDLNIKKKYSSFKDIPGVSHADDLFYLFYNNLNKEAYDNQPKLRDIAHEVTKLWTDFAKYGNPTPDGSLGVAWQPYTPSGKEYFNIQEKYSNGQYADKDRIEFWNQIYREAGLPYIGQ
ncbi:juvenile hormone esterase-like isoform X1 [Pieris napi]|uniref:juvenile hormone esterase-like isoform X1 n=1 Tax=Pieris napi TaxID=78633 RepID=UPI001FB915D8|nr:juvenile hormone esterase-like isoform X1 [Pieris napi]XP_047515898.1 juvenile hormone esterase-like isoform X1 [Pieris napi]